MKLEGEWREREREREERGQLRKESRLCIRSRSCYRSSSFGPGLGGSRPVVFGPAFWGASPGQFSSFHTTVVAGKKVRSGTKKRSLSMTMIWTTSWVLEWAQSRLLGRLQIRLRRLHFASSDANGSH